MGGVTLTRITSNEFLELLEQIKARPELYLGTKSLPKLSYFLDGFFHAIEIMERSEYKESIFPKGFQEWIEIKYDITESRHWSDIINFICFSEDDAFDTFYKLFYEFLSLSEQERKYENILRIRDEWMELKSDYWEKLDDIRGTSCFKKDKVE